MQPLVYPGALLKRTVASGQFNVFFRLGTKILSDYSRHAIELSGITSFQIFLRVKLSIHACLADLEAEKYNRWSTGIQFCVTNVRVMIVSDNT